MKRRTYLETVATVAMSAGWRGIKSVDHDRTRAIKVDLVDSNPIIGPSDRSTWRSQFTADPWLTTYHAGMAVFFEAHDGRRRSGRIGVATAPGIDGPWTVHEQPAIDEQGDQAVKFHLSFPSVCHTEYGPYMVTSASPWEESRQENRRIDVRLYRSDKGDFPNKWRYVETPIKGTGDMSDAEWRTTDPALIEEGGIYYIVYTARGGPYHARRLGVVKANHPAGPYKRVLDGPIKVGPKIGSPMFIQGETGPVRHLFAQNGWGRGESISPNGSTVALALLRMKLEPEVSVKVVEEVAFDVAADTSAWDSFRVHQLSATKAPGGEFVAVYDGMDRRGSAWHIGGLRFTDTPWE